MHANNIKQMQLQCPARKISKWRVQFHPNRHRFSLPAQNRYFTKVLIQEKLLSQSQPVNPANETDHSELSPHKLNRSLSLSCSAHQESEKGKSQIKNVVSLPRIDSRAIAQGEKQIIGSALGGLNMVDILLLRQGEGKQRKKAQISRSTSIAEEEEYEREEQQPRREGEQERPYEFYDSYLMKQEPKMYRAKHFKLKHKADWSISLGSM